ncbi:unnamed protein product [Orchesella dallaii]|uniref:snRNA-activating protein complex subunit 4 n=1 Tax=Orchesella dallaii TaxID=48710 RepID=A0ABP1RRP9_9HEXA
MDENKGFPYQPPLLTLDDMLNLSNDDDNWDSSAFNISNFFEPIVTPTKNVQQVKKESETASVPTSSEASQYFHPFTSPLKRETNELPESPNCASEGFHQQSQSHHVNPPPVLTIKPEPIDQNFELFVSDQDLATSDESLVTADLRDATNDTYDFHESAKVRSDRMLGDATFSKNETVTKEVRRESGQHTSEDQEEIRVSPRPRLTEVKTDNENDASEDLRTIFIHNRRRKAAICQLQSLINTLKRYSKSLQSFLENEGDVITERHAAQELLGETVESENKRHPFHLAHSVTQAVVSHSNGCTAISRLPMRRPAIWRSSDLLVLQKSVLQSVIARRDFFLNCRYSQLLFEMGFDLEDMERLNTAPTRLFELATLKTILEEHETLSKLKGSVKKPIQTVVVKTNPQTGIPRVFSFPKPETLVLQKWDKLGQIRSETLLSNICEAEIDWLFVIKQMSQGNSTFQIDEEACKLTYSHLIDPKFNNSPWSTDEVMRLRTIRERYPGASWASIAKRLGTQRTPFSCFVKYKMYCVKCKPQQMVQNQSVLDYYMTRYRGNIGRMDYEMFKVTGHYMKPVSLLLAVNRSLNHRKKLGKFSVVEDTLLLLTMELHREHLLETESFEPVAFALPWRYISHWRLRFGRIMTGFYSKMWSLEEDQRLCKLAQEYGPKYKLIQRSFPHKNRKQCRGRYVHLQEVLKTKSLQHYHVLYNSRRKDFHLQTLNNIAKYLEMTIKRKAMGNTKCIREADLEFLKLKRAPSERELECYLLTFKRKVMCAALERLLDCLLKIQENCRECSSEIRISQNLCHTNRRKFDPKCPASTASTLHLACAKLVPLEQLENLTKFEQDVYTYYQYFSMCTVKKKTKRRFLPPLDLLRKLPSIERLIQPADPRKGDPVFVISGQTPKSDSIADVKKEAEVLEQIQKRTRGGIMKGAKRRATKIREDKIRAAKMRWQKAKSNNPNDQVMKENIPSKETGFVDVKCELETDNMSSPTIDAESVLGIGNGNAIRNAAMAMMNDHAYILPMDNPSDLRALSLGQLFAKIGHQE